MEIKEKNEQLWKYITRGGFIQDRNGMWCKEGDNVKQHEKGRYIEGILVFNPFGNIADWRIRYISLIPNKEEFTDYVLTKTLELIQPCEPDICKDFNEGGGK